MSPSSLCKCLWFIYFCLFLTLDLMFYWVSFVFLSVFLCSIRLISSTPRSYCYWTSILIFCSSNADAQPKSYTLLSSYLANQLSSLPSCYFVQPFYLFTSAFLTAGFISLTILISRSFIIIFPSLLKGLCSCLSWKIPPFSIMIST